MLKKIALALAFVAALSGLPAMAQSSFTAKDAAGATQIFRSFNCSSEICSLNVLADVTGAAFGVTGNPLFIGFGTGVLLPSFASTPTFNVGTIAGIATQTTSAAILSALGSPFQAGGSIGNASFGISGTLPAFAATPTFNLGTLNGAATASAQANQLAQETASAAALGTTADAAYAGSGNTTVVGGLKGLYAAAINGTGAIGSAVPLNAIYFGVNVGGNLVGMAPGTAGSAGSQVWSVQGVASMTPLAISRDTTSNGATHGLYSNLLQGDTVLSTGNPLFITGTGTAGSAAANPITVQGIASMTPLLVNPGTSANWNLSWAGGTLGAMANYGTSPGAVLVPGVNAYVTNNITTGTAGAPSTQVVTMQGIASMTPLLVTSTINQGGAVLSATNGVYTNILQGNAVLSVTNPIFNQITDGTNAASVKAASTPSVSTDKAVVVDQRPGTTISTKGGYGAAQLSSASVDISSSGDNIVVTRAVGTIKVYGLELSCATNQTKILMKDGASTTKAAFYNVGTYAHAILPEPAWTTTGTDNFIINLSGATACGGTVWYLDN